MDRDGFWALIHATRRQDWDRYESADCEPHVAAITAALGKLPPQEIIAFYRILDELVWREAYSWELWAASYQLNGGSSDDTFLYFRLWLVGQGRMAFEAATRDPDSLADLPFIQELAVRSPGDLCLDCESLGYAAGEAYEQVTGDELPIDPLGEPPGGPAGHHWDFDDDQQVRARLPRLWALLHIL
jgi:hypothetical protein